MEESLKRLRSIINNKKTREFLAGFRVLGGPTRFKIIVLLANSRDGFNVTELAAMLDSSLSRVSHQLRILKKHGMVSSRGTNRETVYKLSKHPMLGCLFGFLRDQRVVSL